jgi:hypothetical protein
MDEGADEVRAGVAGVAAEATTVEAVSVEVIRPDSVV